MRIGWFIYLALVVVSIFFRAAYEVRYEKYKERQGFKNAYKGSFLFKDFKKEPVLSILSWVIAFGVPGVHLLPILSFAIFEVTSKSMLSKEILEESVKKFDNNIIDGKAEGEEVEVLEGEVVDNDSLYKQEKLREEFEGVLDDMLFFGVMSDMFGTFGDQSAKEELDDAIKDILATYGEYMDVCQTDEKNPIDLDEFDIYDYVVKENHDDTPSGPKL